MTADGSESARHVIRIYRLGDEPCDDLRDSMTAQERIHLLLRLSERAWRLSGKPVPRVPRHRMPVAVRSLK